MTTCFPFVRYVFFIALFIISTAILKTSTTLEVVGFNVLNVFACLFGIYVASDVMEYTTRTYEINGKFQPMQNKKIAYLFSAGVILTFVGILMTTIAYDKMVIESANENRQFKLDDSFRKLVDEIKDISIATISLSIISAIAIFYRWEDLRDIFNNVIDPILNTRVFGAWILRIILCIITVSLGISITGSETYDTNDTTLGIGLILLRVLFGIAFPILMIIFLFMKPNIKYLLNVILGVFMIAFTAWIHGERANDPDYVYNKYEKPLYGLIYVIAGMSILEGGSIYTPNILTALFKIGLPLATVGLSGYLVYLGNKFFQLSKHTHIQ